MAAMTTASTASSRQQRAAEVGVHHDAGRVDDAAQRRRDGRVQQPRDPGDEGGGRKVRAPAADASPAVPASRISARSLSSTARTASTTSARG